MILSIARPSIEEVAFVAPSVKKDNLSERKGEAIVRDAECRIPKCRTDDTYRFLGTSSVDIAHNAAGPRVFSLLSERVSRCALLSNSPQNGVQSCLIAMRAQPHPLRAS